MRYRSLVTLLLSGLLALPGCASPEEEEGAAASEDALDRDEVEAGFTEKDVQLLWMADRDNSFDLPKDPRFKVHHNWLTYNMVPLAREVDEATLLNEVGLSRSAARAVYVYGERHYNMIKFQELQMALDLSTWDADTLTKLGPVDTAELSKSASVESIGKLVAYTRSRGGIDPAPSKLNVPVSAELKCKEESWEDGWLGRSNQNTREFAVRLSTTIEPRGIRYRLANVKVTGPSDVRHIKRSDAIGTVPIDIAGNGRSIIDGAKVSVSLTPVGYSLFVSTGLTEGDRHEVMECMGTLPIH